MGSDWISHGEESYPEAAWLQLEVFFQLSPFVLYQKYFYTNILKYLIGYFQDQVLLVILQGNTYFLFRCFGCNEYSLTQGLTPKRQSVSIFFSHHRHQEKNKKSVSIFFSHHRHKEKNKKSSVSISFSSFSSFS